MTKAGLEGLNEQECLPSLMAEHNVQASAREDFSDHPSSTGLTRNCSSPMGLLIVNADDWGRDQETTDRTLDCIHAGSVSSASAMVFMEDSERAATLARDHVIDAGLHLNFTTPFSSASCPSKLLDHHQRVTKYLRSHRLAQILFHPGLIKSFEYVVSAQLEEFRRIYREEPKRLDGHHHMHLCANVLFQRLLPPGTIVRRNFNFERGEKSLANIFYRKIVDHVLALRHQTVDFFFSLPPFEPPGRLTQIYSLAANFLVEIETHPVNQTEYRYLTEGEIFRQLGAVRIAPPSALFKCGRFHGGRS